MIEDYPGGHKYKTECLREGNFIGGRPVHHGDTENTERTLWDVKLGD